MGAWLESYRQLSPDQQERVQAWLHLNKFICRTLRIDWENWVDDYLNPAMEHPLDYSFMLLCLPEFSGLKMDGAGVTFSKDVDPATAQVARVPLRAKNNLGRLSEQLQDGIAQLLEDAGAADVKVGPADVAKLQKILPREKALAKLKRKDFRAVVLVRDDQDVVARVREDELFRMSVVELGAELRKAWV
ncbi:MAG: hypothetical protein RMA76_16210 [Deltaproteobacteria bacterium]|jgi:mRNA-degrading endonuclease RelE of RelBE toxin-antitoxin system